MSVMNKQNKAPCRQNVPLKRIQVQRGAGGRGGQAKGLVVRQERGTSIVRSFVLSHCFIIRMDRYSIVLVTSRWSERAYHALETSQDSLVDGPCTVGGDTFNDGKYGSRKVRIRRERVKCVLLRVLGGIYAWSQEAAYVGRGKESRT
jgi:hypothetical protein